MDEFKIVVAIAILVSLATLVTIVFIAEDAINNAKIPDIERGTVTSKALATDNRPANYKINLAENQAYFILDNTALYERIQQNQTYLFDCRIDFNHRMILIENATLIPP